MFVSIAPVRTAKSRNENLTVSGVIGWCPVCSSSHLRERESIVVRLLTSR